MTKFSLKLAVSALALVPLLALASPKEVVGVWKSDDIAGGASAGVMTLKKDGTAILAPEGIAAVKGHYKADKLFVDITIPGMGVSTFSYTLDNKNTVMRVRYADGLTQTFNKDSGKK